ncbi:MAG: Asp-tRNA(Asn)/Glu-tRNA(Gln) amidotransferase GatCAB subunit C [Parcubacteria group bacterium]|nr:Asp-tRNA(Asn)/Glu-tRNA(Gln) amidotransferase GatCAB subunit C [Parcubacteria group bacterium]|tara:strand:- start:131 stop:418 length:288 start_codon:yes stop_codon:yes gene_type:complete
MSEINLENIKALSKLSLTKEEEKAIPEQIDSILAYVDKLQEVGAEIEHDHQNGLSSSDLREDVAVETSPEVRDRLFANMPRSEGGYLEVPEVFSE